MGAEARKRKLSYSLRQMDPNTLGGNVKHSQALVCSELGSSLGSAGRRLLHNDTLRCSVREAREESTIARVHDLGIYESERNPPSGNSESIRLITVRFLRPAGYPATSLRSTSHHTLSSASCKEQSCPSLRKPSRCPPSLRQLRPTQGHPHWPCWAASRSS